MAWHVKRDPKTGERYIATNRRGRPLLLNPFTNKGTAFSEQEKTELGLHGLVPAITSTIEQQLERTYENYREKETDLEKFIYLVSLHDRNETLFFRLVHEHIDEMMPIVYTPVVGEASQKFSHIYRRARGIYVPYTQRHNIAQLLANYHAEEPSVIVVTDGERILGLGDQGAGGMGIPIGKLCLYTLCAGVPPETTLPITLDVGTDNDERLNDSLYLGLRQKRVRGEDYQSFIDLFVEAVNSVYPHVLLQWEDFLKENAITQLNRFRNRICSFNDDIQGTASVVMGGLYASARITGEKLRDQRVVIAGAGASAQGISDLIVAAMVEDGLSRDEARARIWTTDSRGLVTTARENLPAFKASYARPADEIPTYRAINSEQITLEEVILSAKPTVLLGVSGTPGIFDEQIATAMAKLNERPLIFPLSNPTSRSEGTPEQLLRWTDGRAIIATGSPFAPVNLDGKTFRIGQCNNCFVFPGVGLGAWVGKVRRISDEMFLDAAKALAQHVSPPDLAEVAVFPRLVHIREISHSVACAVIRRAVQQELAEESMLENLEDRVTDAMWFPEYLPIHYDSTL
ncbi:MAG: NAD-dependent malic enzyme [Acidobacteriota bacterium]|nr:MAG: NAD-dependent malic enzyme [Acidobacteriota bacterium]